MPSVGDTLERFGRSYIFLNPETGNIPSAGLVGTWRLSVDDEYIDDGGDNEIVGDSIITATIDVTEEDVLLGELLYITSSGTAKKAKADNVDTSQVIGVALADTPSGTVVTIGSNLKIDVFNTASIVDNDTTGLFVPGAPYFLSAVNKGQWTITPDTITPGVCVVQCGVANASNQIKIEVQPITEI